MFWLNPSFTIPFCYSHFSASDGRSEKFKKPLILKFSQHFPNFAPLPPPNFEVNPKFSQTPICVYYQSKLMQSLVFLTYRFQKVSKKILWGLGDSQKHD